MKNNQPVRLADIPRLEYGDFLESNTALMQHRACHCVNYFAVASDDTVKLICCIANDADQTILVSSTVVKKESLLPSLTARHLAFHAFERELHEDQGINYTDHPWLKPVRFPHDRKDKNSGIANYPFYKIDSEELHEVGVGPIHAGVIEPGHFRFLCNGEQILHLEIQLGYQHRGIEKLFLQKKKPLERITLAENIAGDTVAGHTAAFVNLWEGLCGFRASEDIQFSRTLAMELERMAIHTGDLSALCTDIAYQLGSAVFGRLRTPLINYFQMWCGNRLAKGLVRTGKNNFHFTDQLGDELKKVLDAYEPDFEEMCREAFKLPTVLARFEKTGTVTYEQASAIGTVGMSARMSGIGRDIRASHPHDLYGLLDHQPVLKNHGDVYSRVQIRKEEIRQSLGYIRKLLENIPQTTENSSATLLPSPNALCVSLVEGWRGEICHCAVTDDKGELSHYKIKDPSLHNWLALALAVRNNEISDFPVCNKSFNLSYCGNDL